jgi:hypothetical protein
MFRNPFAASAGERMSMSSPTSQSAVAAGSRALAAAQNSALLPRMSENDSFSAPDSFW